MFKKRGFTLMELLVVVLLIAILAAMATPQYMKVVEKQKGTSAVNLLASIGKSEERYFGVNEKYSNDFSDLDSDLVDYNSNAAATGPTYYSKYFTFQLEGLDDGTSKAVATRRGNESYILERNYTTGRTCCGNDNTSGGDICDILDINTSLNQCDSSPAEDSGNNGGTSGGTTPTPPSGSCSGTQPASSQICPTGCGTQTRSVTCNSSTGQWVAGNWSGTCTSPTQTQPTTQSCGSGGTQTRSCTASCSGGTCGAWSTCSAIDCSVASVKAANKATCCPSMPKTDTVCYTVSYAWSCNSYSDYNCYTQNVSSCSNGTYSASCGYCVNECSAIRSAAKPRPCDQYYASDCSAGSEGSKCYYVPGGSEQTWAQSDCPEIWGKVMEIDYQDCTCKAAYTKNGW